MGDTYTRQSAAAIATGNVITASDLEDEFDQVLAAFNSSTGHVHDGTDAPRISTIGPAGQYTGTATDFKPTATGLDLGASASQWDNAYIDGIAYIDTVTIGENEYVTITDNEYDVSSGNLTVDVAGNIILDADGGNVTLQDAGVTFANLNNATGELVIQSGSVPTTAVTFSGANADFAGTVDVTGAVTLDSTLNVTGAITGDLTGNADTATAWAAGIEIALTGDVTGTVTGVDGSGNVSIATTVSADATELGTDTTGNYVASITNGTYITGGDGGSESAALTIAVDATDANTASKVVARDASGDFAAGTITASLTGNVTGDVTSTGTSTFTTVDINGGAIDGSTIGATTPSTGAFTSVDVDGGTLDGVSIGDTTAATSVKIDSLTIDNVSSVPTLTVDASSGTDTAGTNLALYSGASTGQGATGQIQLYGTLSNNISGTTGNTHTVAYALTEYDTASSSKYHHDFTGKVTADRAEIDQIFADTSMNSPIYTIENSLGSTVGKLYSTSSTNFTIGNSGTSGSSVQLTSTNSTTVSATNSVNISSDTIYITHNTTNASAADSIQIREIGTSINYGTLRYDAGFEAIALGNSLLSTSKYAARIRQTSVEAQEFYQRVNTLSVTGATTLTSQQHYHRLTMTGNSTISIPDAALSPTYEVGARVTVWITGAYTLAWGGSNISWDNNSTPSYTGTGLTADIYEFISVGASNKWHGRKVISNSTY